MTIFFIDLTSVINQKNKKVKKTTDYEDYGPIENKTTDYGLR